MRWCACVCVCEWLAVYLVLFVSCPFSDSCSTRSSDRHRLTLNHPHTNTHTHIQTQVPPEIRAALHRKHEAERDELFNSQKQLRQANRRLSTAGMCVSVCMCVFVRFCLFYHLLFLPLLTPHPQPTNLSSTLPFKQTHNHTHTNTYTGGPPHPHARARSPSDGTTTHRRTGRKQVAPSHFPFLPSHVLPLDGPALWSGTL